VPARGVGGGKVGIKVGVKVALGDGIIVGVRGVGVL